MATIQQGLQNSRSPIHPARVRYIKLGEAGKWEKECLEKGIELNATDIPE
jgi:hypothetical protein